MKSIFLYLAIFVIILVIPLTSAAINITQDEANSTSCLGNFDGGHPCAHGYDSDFATYAAKDAVEGTSYVYENFNIIPFTFANITQKYALTGGDHFTSTCYNSTDEWSKLIDFESSSATKTVNIPLTCMATDTLKIRSQVSYSSGGSTTCNYYEGLINWFSFDSTNEINYTNPDYETAASLFILNLSNESTVSSVTANFTYDGTTHSIPSANIGDHGKNWMINRTIDLPLGAETNTFYFSYIMTYSNGSKIYNQTKNNQTVLPLSFEICGNSTKTPSLNISYRNESASQDYMNASVPSSTWSFWLGSGTVKKDTTYSTATQSFNHSFCINPSTQTLYTDVTYNYVATDYIQRIYQATLTLPITITQKILWLLGTSDGIYVTFQVINTANQVLEGTNVNVSKTINGALETLETRDTDDAGTATFWLNPNDLHSITFDKTGYDILTLSIYPTQSTYTVTLGGDVSTNVSNYYRGISYDIYPVEKILQNDTTYTFRFNITSNYWNLEEYGFELVNETGYVYSTATAGTTATGGSVSKSFDLTNIGNETWIAMNYYWVIEGNYTNGTYAWGVYSTYEGEFSIKNFFDDFNIFMQDPIFGAHGGFTKTIIAFAIIFMIIGTLAYVSGIYSPIAILSGMTILAWLFAHPDINLITPINNLWVFIPVVLTVITIAYAIWEYRS